MYKFLAVSLALLLAPAAIAANLSIVNPDFSAVPIVCGLGYAYESFGGDCAGPFVPQQSLNGTPNIGWTFGSNLPNSGGDGITRPSTNFFPPPNIAYGAAAFLQSNNTSVSQAIPGFVAGGEYTLTFYLGSRYFSGGFDGDQTVVALIDGNVVGTWSLVSYTPFTLETVSFNVGTSGSRTLEFIGLNAGDHTAFLTDVALQQTVPEPSTLVPLAISGVGLLTSLRLKRR